MSRFAVDIRVEDNDEITARYHEPRRTTYGDGYVLDLPASLHVSIGQDTDLWGPPEVVLRKLCDALARAREAEAAGSQEVITDLGGAA